MLHVVAAGALALAMSGTAPAAEPGGAIVLASAPVEFSMPVHHTELGRGAEFVYECEPTTNVFRTLRGCTDLIRSGDASRDSISRAYKTRAMAFFTLGQKERARQDLDRAVRYAPKNASVYYVRGTVFQQMGEHALALEDFDKAIEFDPQNAAAWSNRGVAFEKLGDSDRAMESYDRSIQIDPENAISFNNRGNAWSRLGEHARAIADYDQALRIDPGYARAYYNRAGERCKEGQAHDAIDDYLLAMQLGRKERRVMQEFLAEKGYLDGEPATEVGPAVEAALRSWGLAVCAEDEAPLIDAQGAPADRSGRHASR